MWKGSLTGDQIDKVLDELGEEAVGRILRDEVEVQLTSKVVVRSFKVRINFDQPIEQKTATGFNYVNSNLTSKNFPVQQEGIKELECVVVNFGKSMKTSEVLAWFEKNSIEPGVPTGLADLSNQHQTKEFDAYLPLVALKPVWRDVDGDGYVACLSGKVGLRALLLRYAADGWDEYSWFFGFRK